MSKAETNGTTKAVLLVNTTVPAEALSNGAYRVERAGNVKEAIERIAIRPVPSLILLGMGVGQESGLEVLSQLRQLRPSIPIIMLASASDPRDVVRAIRLGAEDCVTKPNSAMGLKMLIEDRLIALSGQGDCETEDCVDALNNERFFVAVSPAMRKLREQVRHLAKVDEPVLFLGESGTGKEVVARLIHLWSTRANRGFVKVNCAALPAELLESELFGFERGAFTGAERSKPGKFELTQGGTILLDEIGELSTPLQAKLLHVLQDREFTRLGGRTKIKVNVRPLAATNVDIPSAITAKTFRQDLFYRLSTFVVQVPPLRERREDIPALLKRYVRYYADLHRIASRELTPDILERCYRYEWPGNVRELENFARRYLILGDPRPDAASEEMGRTSAPAVRMGPQLSQESGDFKTQIRGVKREAEGIAIQRALDDTRWNKTAAAKLLKISYKSLLSKIRQHDLEKSPQRVLSSDLRDGY
jgi:DNA-binding NtrC family response regulator